MPIPELVPVIRTEAMGNRLLWGDVSVVTGCAQPFGETLRSPVAPGGDQRLANGAQLGGPQPDIGCTTATPTALDRSEDRRLGSHEQLLLLRGELDHAPAAAGIA